MTLFDTHCHLDTEAFDADREATLARATAAQVTHIVNPAYDLNSSRRTVAYAAGHANVFAAIGIHPNDINVLDVAGLAELEQLAAQPKVVAVGEIGLDYHWNAFTPDVQKVGFQTQLNFARSHGLPVIVHCRDAYDDLLAILEGNDSDTRILLHSFSGSWTHAESAIERGYYFGIGGPVTYKKANELREIVRNLPLDRIVLETDAPYLAPQPHRGHRNEPSYLPITAGTVADLLGTSLMELASLTSSTACGFFGLT